MAQLALSWVFRQDAVTTAVIGARTIGQMDELMYRPSEALSADELTGIQLAVAA